MTNKELKETLERVDKIIVDIDKIVLDTSAYTSSQSLRYDTSNMLFSFREPKLDTSDVIVKYIFNWEEGEIETVTGKIVHPRLTYGVYLGKPDSSDTKFFKVSNGVWIPVEWPKDIVELYIRPKE